MSATNLLIVCLVPSLSAQQTPKLNFAGDWKRTGSPIYYAQFHLDPNGTFDATGGQAIQTTPVPARYLHGTWQRVGPSIQLRITDSAIGSIFGHYSYAVGKPQPQEYFPWSPTISGTIIGTISNDGLTIQMPDPFGLAPRGLIVPMMTLERTDQKMSPLDWKKINMDVKRSKPKFIR